MIPMGWRNGGEVSRVLVGVNAALAQLVEHRIRNAGVTGSSPVSGTMPYPRQSQRHWPKGTLLLI